MRRGRSTSLGPGDVRGCSGVHQVPPLLYNRFLEHWPEAGFVRASHVSNARRLLGPACRDLPEGVSDEAARFPCTAVPHWVPETPPALAAPVTRWLSGRLQTSDRAESVRRSRDAFRYFLRWLAQAHPRHRRDAPAGARARRGLHGPPARAHQRPLTAQSATSHWSEPRRTSSSKSSPSAKRTFHLKTG